MENFFIEKKKITVSVCASDIIQESNKDKDIRIVLLSKGRALYKDDIVNKMLYVGDLILIPANYLSKLENFSQKTVWKVITYNEKCFIEEKKYGSFLYIKKPLFVLKQQSSFIHIFDEMLSEYQAGNSDSQVFYKESFSFF